LQLLSESAAPLGPPRRQRLFSDYNSERQGTGAGVQQGFSDFQRSRAGGDFYRGSGRLRGIRCHRPGAELRRLQRSGRKGKIVALVLEAPNFESSLKAHYSTSEVKAANAVAHGAVGVIVLNDPVLESIYSFSERIRDSERPGLRWLEKDGTPHDTFPEI